LVGETGGCVRSRPPPEKSLTVDWLRPEKIMRVTSPALFASAMLLSACATRPMPAPGHDADVGRSFGQPLRDLSVIREEAPRVLQRAAVAPYDLERAGDCPAIAVELAALDAALGPDLSPGPKAGGVSVDGLAAGLIGGAIGLPFRSVVRLVTGAQAREQALKAAVLAGMVRRGFLKGRLGLMACGPAKAATAPAH
jgi:hypothetical protein